MKQFEDVSLDVVNSIAHLTVTRPSLLNAYRNKTADELLEALRQAEADAAVSVLVLSGQGRAFGAGYDLSVVSPGEEMLLDDVLEKHFNPLVVAMRASRLPIVAAVQGACAGAAVGIALAADIVVAARSAYFYQPFLGIALVPDAGNTLFLTRKAGRAKATGMMLLGDRISAEQAEQWGLTWKTVDDSDLGDTCAAIATKLASLAPAAVAATKRLISAADDFAIEPQLALERDLQGIAGRTPEFKQAVASFFASRKRTNG